MAFTYANIQSSIVALFLGFGLLITIQAAPTYESTNQFETTSEYSTIRKSADDTTTSSSDISSVPIVTRNLTYTPNSTIVYLLVAGKLAVSPKVSYVTTQSTGSSDTLSSGAIAGIVIGIIVLLCLCGCCGVCCKTKSSGHWENAKVYVRDS